MYQNLGHVLIFFFLQTNINCDFGMFYMFNNVAFNSHISVVRVHFIFHRSYHDPITSPFLSFFILFRNDPSQYYENTGISVVTGSHGEH